MLPSSLRFLLFCYTYFFASSYANALAFQLDTKVRVQSSRSIHVEKSAAAAGSAVNLNTYMTLPVEQYVLVPMPLNAKLSKSDDEFLLTVPPLKFFNLEVQPLVKAQVILEADKVVITSHQCRLQSPNEASYIEKVNLNDRFQFQAQCVLTWDEQEDHTIFAHTQIHVDVDPPPPFSKLPRSVLEATGNAAMRISMNYIIQSFLKGLAMDYQKWAHDDEYRQTRRALSLQPQNDAE